MMWAILIGAALVVAGTLVLFRPTLIDGWVIRIERCMVAARSNHGARVWGSLVSPKTGQHWHWLRLARSFWLLLDTGDGLTAPCGGRMLRKLYLTLLRKSLQSTHHVSDGW